MQAAKLVQVTRNFLKHILPGRPSAPIADFTNLFGPVGFRGEGGQRFMQKPAGAEPAEHSDCAGDEAQDISVDQFDPLGSVQNLAHP